MTNPFLNISRHKNFYSSLNNKWSTVLIRNKKKEAKKSQNGLTVGIFQQNNMLNYVTYPSHNL